MISIRYSLCLVECAIGEFRALDTSSRSVFSLGKRIRAELPLSYSRFLVSDP
jgi:hypothetical protein